MIDQYGNKHRTCKDCRHWQGTKYSKWGDCYRVVLALEPELGNCCLCNEYGTEITRFTSPFDPHDAKYWSFSPFWRKLYDSMTVSEGNAVSPKRQELREGVRVIEVIKDDIIFDSQNGERIGKLKLKYFQTHKEYDCDEI